MFAKLFEQRAVTSHSLTQRRHAVHSTDYELLSLLTSSGELLISFAWVPQGSPEPTLTIVNEDRYQHR